jgi:hypothetical protein
MRTSPLSLVLFVLVIPACFAGVAIDTNSAACSLGPRPTSSSVTGLHLLPTNNVCFNNLVQTSVRARCLDNSTVIVEIFDGLNCSSSPFIASTFSANDQTCDSREWTRSVDSLSANFTWSLYASCRGAFSWPAVVPSPSIFATGFSSGEVSCPDANAAVAEGGQTLFANYEHELVSALGVGGSCSNSRTLNTLVCETDGTATATFCPRALKGLVVSFPPGSGSDIGACNVQTLNISTGLISFLYQNNCPLPSPTQNPSTPSGMHF